jgi:phage shock protein PspC (stress-responsive transcriptional regulator)
MATKRCPFCAEEIQMEAVRCRYCRSRLVSFGDDRWHRSHPEARVAGVCAALAHALAIPIGLVRMAFVAFSVFLHFAPLVYVALWLVIPERPGGVSELERILKWALSLFSTLRDHGSRDSQWTHPSAPDNPSAPEPGNPPMRSAS